MVPGAWNPHERFPDIRQTGAPRPGVQPQASLSRYCLSHEVSKGPTRIMSTASFKSMQAKCGIAILPLVGIVLALIATPSLAQNAGSGSEIGSESPAAINAEVALYCESIREPAQEARVRWQAQALLEIEERIEERMRELAALRTDYEEWLARRQEFLRKAEDGVIDIYARMRPDAAAAQLASMDNETASAVIAKLNPRQASAILNEMEPGRAAQLTKTVAGTALTQENAL
jgi:flagellar motility protein MotE (MotC chaperone)